MQTRVLAKEGIAIVEENEGWEARKASECLNNRVMNQSPENCVKRVEY
jgi:hypothetical protein